MTSAYTFGHSATAAERLRTLAGVYEAETEGFLRAWAPAEAGLAIDLGCGPGYTTGLIAKVVGAERTVGIDISEEFVGQARRERGQSASFHVHDVTAPPFPGGPADLLFCRLLVTHLPNPAVAMGAWVAALAPGGRLLIDEVAAIEVAEPTCARYLEIAGGVIGLGGGDLYVGSTLASMAPRSARLLLDEDVPYDVSIGDAASMFRLNIPSWEERAIGGGLTTAAELSAIAARMDALAEGREDGPGLRWRMQHLVLEAPG